MGICITCEKEIGVCRCGVEAQAKIKKAIAEIKRREREEAAEKKGKGKV